MLSKIEFRDEVSVSDDQLPGVMLEILSKCTVVYSKGSLNFVYKGLDIFGFRTCKKVFFRIYVEAIKKDLKYDLFDYNTYGYMHTSSEKKDYRKKLILELLYKHIGMDFKAVLLFPDIYTSKDRARFSNHFAC